MRKMIRILIALVVWLGAVAPAMAQQRELWPGAQHDPAIPAPDQVIGHALGERLTPSAEIARYIRALQQSAPDRMVVGEYGKTWEGRSLPWAAISSASNIARLDEIRAASLALADPRRTPPAAAGSIIARQPVIVWLGYGVHGNEVGPPEAAMAVARHLLAARGDPRVASFLENAVVVLVPTQNPDGRDRFIAGHESARGLDPEVDPLSAEKAELWPSGRFNHYLFNLNRDWFAQTQPETRGHAKLMLGWRPQVVADAHEMGLDSTFFFPPEAEPVNPLLPPAQLRSRQLFGRAHAAMFDREGLDYFTREVYDAFYPGYGDAWPGYFGAISMTYEQASARGLGGRRKTGEILTLFDTVRSQFLVSLSTIETAVANREQLLSDFYAYHESAVREGRSKGVWLIDRPSHDPGTADRLGTLLASQGIDVRRSPAPFSACGRSWQAGTYVVDMAQPQSRLVSALLDPTIALKPEFVAEQERRRAKALPAEVYDVTAWALPAMFNTPAALCKARPPQLEQVSGEPRPGEAVGSPDSVAWIVPAGSQGMRVLSAALRGGLRVRSSARAFSLGGRTFPSGSLILTRSGNPADLQARLATYAAAAGAEVIGVGETWVTDGPNFGSELNPVLVAPRIAMAWSDPTDPSSAGAVRYVIEREYGYPVTVIRTARLREADLSRYDVLILPDGGNYRSLLTPDGIGNIRSWLRRGGVLVGIGGAVDMLAHPESELLASRLETLATEDGKEKPKPAKEEEKSPTVAGSRITDAAAYAKALQPQKGSPDPAVGVLARAIVDQDHWLAVGVAPQVNVLVEGKSIYTPLTYDKGVNAVHFASSDDLLVAGHLWKENRLQLAFKPFVMVQPQGQGQLIAFTQDPTARGYMRGLDILFLNAILRGPSYTSKVR